MNVLTLMIYLAYMLIAVGGITESGEFYVIDSWEKRASPEFALKKALYFAIKYGAEKVCIEKNQGGTLWLNLWDAIVEESGLDEDRIPGVELVTATSSSGSKIERASQLLVDYELGKVYHVVNEQATYIELEAAFRRFGVTKPYDRVDSVYWAWSDCKNANGWVI